MTPVRRTVWVPQNPAEAFELFTADIGAWWPLSSHGLFGERADDHSEVDIRFNHSGTGTEVVLEHRGWERFGADTVQQRRRYIGPGTWGGVLEHFTDLCEPRTDGAIAAVSHGIIHGHRLRFENLTCHDPDVLAKWITTAAGRGGLIEEARRSSARVLGVLGRLNAEQRATEVHCRLVHEGEVMVDEPRPWGVIAIEVQAGMHLPAHVEQLRKLRVD